MLIFKLKYYGRKEKENSLKTKAYGTQGWIYKNKRKKI